MRHKNLKTFEQYVMDYEESIIDNPVSREQMEDLYRKYTETYFNQILMLDVADGYKLDYNINDSSHNLIYLLMTGIFENDANKFHKSYNNSRRLEYLTPYTVKDLKEFDLYKVRGYDVGFAIKDGSEIILVHNNSGVKGIGELLIEKAIEKGGSHLDHFDGFLTNFYKEIGFKFESNLIFDRQYAPKKWTYEKVDIDSSIYADEHKVSSNDYDSAVERYNKGEPDIVFRKL